jgi:membrane-bound metal-dependent hydrolase YbcI (DUF457 family)
MRAKGHQITGVVIGGAWVLAEWWHKKQTNPIEQFPIGKFLGYTGAGFFIASLPDWIEPSKGNPNHRQFFHSVSFVALLVGLQRSDWLNAQSDSFQAVVRAVIFQYLVHVGADSLSKRGIPLVHTRFV